MHKQGDENKNLCVKNNVFEVTNGMTDMKLIVVLRLVDLMWKKDDNIRAVFGMCAEHYKWKIRRVYVLSRYERMNLPNEFLPNPRGTFLLTSTSEGVNCIKENGRLGTLFLSTLITEGVFRWTIQVFYTHPTKTAWFYLGVCPSNRVRECDGQGLSGYVPDTCSYYFGRWGSKGFQSVLENVVDFHVNCKENIVPDKSMVAVEVDTNSRTMCFFVNGRKLPFGISDIVVPLYLGVNQSTENQYESASFTSLWFRRLPRLTLCSLPCNFYQCKHPPIY